MARRIRKISVTEKYYGDEPALLGPRFKPEMLTRTFNYYNALYDVKTAREWVSEWLKKDNWDTHYQKGFERIPNSHVMITICVLARLLNHGCDIGSEDKKWFDNYVKRLVDTYKPDPNRSFNKPIDVSLIISDMEDVLDQFFRSGYTERPDVFQWLTNRSPKQIEVTALIGYYQELYNDLTDPEKSEFYKKLTKKQLVAYRNFVADILNDAGTYVKNTTKERAVSRPKKKTTTPISKQVGKVQFLSSYSDLKLVSINPTNIPKADILWLYDTVKRKLVYMKAKDGGFQVTGTTIKNVDNETSRMKTIRKPTIMFPDFINNTKNRMNKIFQEIKSAETKISTRINKDMIILKAFK